MHSGFSDERLPNNLHRVLERLEAIRQVIDDLVLRDESVLHFVLELLTHLLELNHGILLEFLNVLVLHFQLPIGVVAELAERETLVGALIVNFLAQAVLFVVELLQDVLLAINSRLALAIESRLQHLNFVARFKNQLVRLGYAILDLLGDRLFEPRESLVGTLELFTVV